MKVKKKYVEAIKATLKCFPLLEEHHKCLNESLDRVRGNDGLKAFSYYNDRVQTSNINSSVETTALHNLDEEREILSDIKECERKIEIIKSAIDKLDQVTAAVMKLKYMKRLPWLEIEDEVGYSERTCRSRLTEGMKDLAVIFYGERAFDIDSDVKIS